MKGPEALGEAAPGERAAVGRPCAMPSAVTRKDRTGELARRRGEIVVSHGESVLACKA